MMGRAYSMPFDTDVENESPGKTYLGLPLIGTVTGLAAF
jgi:hypothetical protein